MIAEVTIETLAQELAKAGAGRIVVLPNNEIIISRKHTAISAAAYLGMSKSNLDNKRRTGFGPRYEYADGRILYDQDDLDAWLTKVDPASLVVREVGQ